MYLTEHFSLEEFQISQWAARHNVANIVPAELMGNAKATCAMLERIRAVLNVPIAVTSGYRNVQTNAAVGGKPASDHLLAMAADIIAPRFGNPYKIAQLLAGRIDELQIGQVIHEFGMWVHVSTRMPASPVNRILTISGAGTVVGIKPI
jgi:hypothetical protein